MFCQEALAVSTASLTQSPWPSGPVTVKPSPSSVEISLSELSTVLSRSSFLTVAVADSVPV